MSNSDDTKRLSPATLIGVIAIGMLVATLSNGAATYLKRVGLLEGPSYQRYFSDHCSQVTRTAAGSCCVARNPNQASSLLAQGLEARAASAYLFESAGGEVLLKRVKDAFAMAFIALSVLLVVRGRTAVPQASSSIPLLLLTLAASLGFFTTLWHSGGAIAIAGLWTFLFLPVALLASWSAPGLPVIAKWAAMALVFQSLLMPYEWSHGMPLRFCPNSLRAAGSLVLPNSLGVFAATTSAFCLAFLQGRTTRAALLALALLLVIASGSATGLIALLAIVSMLAVQNSTRIPRTLVAPVFIASLLLLIPALPALTGRIDLFASVLGSNARLDSLIGAWRSATFLEMILGHGLGYGTNLSVNLGHSVMRPPDSAAVALFMQLGVFGTCTFYAALAWGFRRHVALRPFFLAVAICSLTLNVIELFPLNFLMGLALAACLAPPSTSQVS